MGSIGPDEASVALKEIQSSEGRNTATTLVDVGVGGIGQQPLHSAFDVPPFLSQRIWEVNAWVGG